MQYLEGGVILLVSPNRFSGRSKRQLFETFDRFTGRASGSDAVTSFCTTFAVVKGRRQPDTLRLWRIAR